MCFIQRVWLYIIAAASMYPLNTKKRNNKVYAYLENIPSGSVVKNLPAMQETRGWPLGREDPSEGRGNPLQYSCLENPTDWEAWKAAVHGVIKSWTQLKQLSTHSKNIKRCRDFNINLNDYLFELNKKFINYLYL